MKNLFQEINHSTTSTHLNTFVMQWTNEFILIPAEDLNIVYAYIDYVLVYLNCSKFAKSQAIQFHVLDHINWKNERFNIRQWNSQRPAWINIVYLCKCVCVCAAAYAVVNGDI